MSLWDVIRQSIKPMSFPHLMRESIHTQDTRVKPEYDTYFVIVGREPIIYKTHVIPALDAGIYTHTRSTGQARG